MRTSALQNRSFCFLVCSGNHRKTDLVSFGHKSLFLSRPSKNCGKCLKCLALFSTILSLELSPNENFNRLPWFGTRPLNISRECLLLCPLPLLCQVACPKSCAFLFSFRADASWVGLQLCSKSWAGFFGVQHEWILNLNILGRENTVFGQKAPFLSPSLSPLKLIFFELRDKCLLKACSAKEDSWRVLVFFFWRFSIPNWRSSACEADLSCSPIILDFVF